MTITVETRDNGERFYIDTRTGLSVPSVTTLLGKIGDPAGLVIWKMRQAHEAGLREEPWPVELDQTAADHGRAVHAHVEDALKSGELPIGDNKAARQALAVLDWIRESGWRVAHSELVLMSSFYGGTIDLVFLDVRPPLTVWVVDLKTGSAIHAEHGGQLGAYLRLWGQRADDALTGLPVRLGVLHSRPRSTRFYEVDASAALRKWQAALDWLHTDPIVRKANL